MANSHVLVAIADPATRGTLARPLELEGYSVTVVADGETAMAALRSERPDIMLIDVSLPGIGGHRLCRLVRADRNRTPVLLLATGNEISDLVAGLNAGADDWMVRPFKLEELLARMRALLCGVGGDPTNTIKPR